ncbi:5-methylcytosine restriction system specificity protein McrC [Aeromonas veronii]|uniref:5-methylcytosine restriction system specificity protein McrC n=1 Tax=Aeromonas veronii TaxID=654 RepID=UPI00197B69A4|nr:hypothetical protein [Aeromonas veronii]
MDTKWKRLEQDNRRDKFGLGQQDFYQMLAYGQTYQKGVGDMLLIYPQMAWAEPCHWTILAGQCGQAAFAALGRTV